MSQIDYATASLSVTINVDPATPTITSPAPAAITYGTALSSIQLNATASVPGTLTYSPANGAISNAGTQTVKVVVHSDGFEKLRASGSEFNAARQPCSALHHSVVLRRKSVPVKSCDAYSNGWIQLRCSHWKRDVHGRNRPTGNGHAERRNRDAYEFITACRVPRNYGTLLRR